MQSWEKKSLAVIGAVAAFVILLPVYRSPYDESWVSLPVWSYHGIIHKQLPHLPVKAAIINAKARILIASKKR